MVAPREETLVALRPRQKAPGVRMRVGQYRIRPTSRRACAPVIRGCSATRWGAAA